MNRRQTGKAQKRANSDGKQTAPLIQTWSAQRACDMATSGLDRLRLARQLTQGRRVVQAALIASIPRTRPAVWLSDERVAASGIDPRCLHGLSRNSFVAATKVPSRLFWQVRLLTPEIDHRMRQQRRHSEQARRERRLALEALPPLEFAVSYDRSRMSF